jgi:hypothetical protein
MFGLERICPTIADVSTGVGRPNLTKLCASRSQQTR